MFESWGNVSLAASLGSMTVALLFLVLSLKWGKMIKGGLWMLALALVFLGGAVLDKDNLLTGKRPVQAAVQTQPVAVEEPPKEEAPADPAPPAPAPAAPAAAEPVTTPAPAPVAQQPAPQPAPQQQEAPQQAIASDNITGDEPLQKNENGVFRVRRGQMGVLGEFTIYNGYGDRVVYYPERGIGYSFSKVVVNGLTKETRDLANPTYSGPIKELRDAEVSVPLLDQVLTFLPGEEHTFPVHLQVAPEARLGKYMAYVTVKRKRSGDLAFVEKEMQFEFEIVE
ncbi:hypothetical protein OS242_17670 [Tumebacillus sp. DT12]|uniref:DUF4352 domain-containing protein n=1 Tax=Tumebacillus lacus TaxID=2995335 RepID=A0ABT3X4E8_9BACL|nr:hypothetical protein [Tumebacillus lacus]MCX7571775.1 hypothetical protein [Tumebacillus lacus]